MDATSDGFRCLCCDGTAAAPAYRACRDLYLRTPFLTDYDRCTTCGLVQQSPVPRDVAPFYAGYPVHRRKSGAFDLVRRILMSRVYFRPGPSVLRLLDYGCGDGSYLARVKRPGLEAFGYEPDAALARDVAARTGLAVFSDVNDLRRQAGRTLDALTMHSVLEHLTDLHAAFDLAASLLRPGGVFYFVVPQADSGEARLFGRKWHGLDPPRHISFPGPPVVRRLAARHGFHVARHEAVPFPTALAGSVSNVAVGRFSFPVMVAALPFTLAVTRLAPGAVRAFRLERAG